MKVVVEKVRRFICVVKTKFPCFENFPFHNQQAALRVFIRNEFVAVGYNIRRSLILITRYFGTNETCYRFRVNLSIETSASLCLHCGNLTLVNSFDAKFGCFIFPPTRNCSFFRKKPFITLSMVCGLLVNLKVITSKYARF